MNNTTKFTLRNSPPKDIWKHLQKEITSHVKKYKNNPFETVYANCQVVFGTYDIEDEFTGFLMKNKIGKSFITSGTHIFWKVSFNDIIPKDNAYFDTHNYYGQLCTLAHLKVILNCAYGLNFTYPIREIGEEIK